jgi:serine protease inhibitor
MKTESALNAATIFHGVYGGAIGVQSPFHMTLDRPFLFIIRDNVTRAPLFVGVVMNPAQENCG